MSAAVLAMAYNEPVFFPIWQRYYSRFFSPEDIYVIDHETTDGSLDGEGFVRIPVNNPHDDRTWRTRLVERHQRQLLETYDVVVTTDIDEIVAPDPSLGTLGSYLEAFDREFVNCVGYEVLHMRDTEPPLDPTRPILAQRGWWYANPGYNKPIVATEPVRWVPGFHHREDGRIEPDPRLRLVHLHRADFELALERHRVRAERPSDPDDVASGRGYQNRIVDTEAFESWFYGDSCFEAEGVRIEPERIPERWRSLL
jgi:hypothetical protein